MYTCPKTRIKGGENMNKFQKFSLCYSIFTLVLVLQA